MGHFKDSTVYQIYTKSFQDTTGNGLGDIRGVISRLDYLRELGIDYIWLTPFFAPLSRIMGTTCRTTGLLTLYSAPWRMWRNCSGKRMRGAWDVCLIWYLTIHPRNTSGLRRPLRETRSIWIIISSGKGARTPPPHQLAVQIRGKCLGVCTPPEKVVSSPVRCKPG